MSRQVDHRPDLRLAGALGGLTLVALGGLSWWVSSVRPRLPDPVAHHWGASGEADGFASLDTTLWMTVGIVAAVSVPIGAVAVLARQPALVRRLLAGVAGFLVVFVTVLVADSLRGQLDLADARLAPLPGPGMGVGVVLGMVAAVGTGAFARRDGESVLATRRPPSAAPRFDHAELPWISRTRGLDTAAEVVAVAAGLGLVGLAVFLTLWLLPMALLVSGLVLGMGRVTTTIDDMGLSARVLGLRILHVPVTQVAEASVIDVDPFWEFGGWGLRVGAGGRVGLVTRKGPALSVRRGDDSEIVITLEAADTAAAILNSLADTRQQDPGTT